MSISINPYLIARLVAVQRALAYPGMLQPSFAGDMGFEPAVARNPSKDWKEFLGDDDKGDGSGGGGTIRGNRGKNAEYAKTARRLTRGGSR